MTTIFNHVATKRIRSSSPFPSAYKVLADVEISTKKTIKVPAAWEHLLACKQRDGVKCKNCNTWDETGLDWNVVVFMEEDASPKYSWFCKLCFRAEDHPKSSYVYSGVELENSTDKVKK